MPCGESKVDRAVRNLLRLWSKASSNEAARSREPEFMAVLVANAPYARRCREDGIYVTLLFTLTV